MGVHTALHETFYKNTSANQQLALLMLLLVLTFTCKKPELSVHSPFVDSQCLLHHSSSSAQNAQILIPTQHHPSQILY